MNIVNYLPLKREFLIAAAVCCATPTQADLLYMLEPGSTITPVGSQIGPSEPLTGTFTWHLYAFEPGQNLAGFDATSLAFQSASFVLTLDITAANKYGSSVFGNTHTSYFSDIVDWDGLPGVPLQINCPVIGTFEGPLESPTRLMYPQLSLNRLSGGGSLALLSFEAVQVPESSSLILLLIGFALLARRGLLRKNAQRPRWSEWRLPFELMNGLGHTTIIEPAVPLARRRGPALER